MADKDTEASAVGAELVPLRVSSLRLRRFDTAFLRDFDGSGGWRRHLAGNPDAITPSDRAEHSPAGGEQGLGAKVLDTSQCRGAEPAPALVAPPPLLWPEAPVAVGGHALGLVAPPTVGEVNLITQARLSDPCRERDRVYALAAAATRAALQQRPPSASEFDDLLCRLLRVVARQVRAAYLSGDRDFPTMVREFAFGWLGLRPRAEFRVITIEAVTDVPIAENWDDLLTAPDARTSAGLQNALVSGARLARDNWKPTWTRRINRQAVGSLNVTTTLVDGGTVERGERIAADLDVASAVVESMVADEMLTSLVPEFTLVERAIVDAVIAGMNWREAARACGRPESAGDNLLRRVKRARMRLVTRASARGDVDRVGASM